MKAKLCKRLNTYIIESCDNCKCDWYKAQGIGSLTGNTATAGTVTDLGSELVQNGNFEELGSELVINGSFDTDSSWVKEASWSIENGKATYDAVTNVEYIYQNLDFQSGKNYKITFTISDVDEAGGKQAYFALWTIPNGSENVFTYTKFNNGTYTFYYTSVNGYIIYFNALNSSNGGAFSIDNVSVKQVDPNWGKVNATISDGKGNLDGNGQTSLLYQDILTNTKTYQATFTVSNYNAIGQAKVIDNTGTPLYNITSNGTFTFTFTHSEVSGNFLFRASEGAIFSIDNVSVKEVL